MITRCQSPKPLTAIDTNTPWSPAFEQCQFRLRTTERYQALMDICRARRPKGPNSPAVWYKKRPYQRLGSALIFVHCLVLPALSSYGLCDTTLEADVDALPSVLVLGMETEDAQGLIF
ncbi:hypothetical protein BT69DRAFT_1282348 [Atractiella rhizophila]|nr:hypothetical protein BT69DRAFT_1282986 [Atractiella rhizophila]KAH8922296.1 hypothetical protein BT69DRAFT_1282348 [Atractiella rhizophila]